MDRRRTLAVLLAAALLVTAGAAPASAAGPKGKVVIWYDSGAAWNPFIADFNKQLATQYPDITVEWVTQDAAQLSAKLVAAFAAKQGPDIALGSQYRLVAVEQQFKAWADLSGRASSDAELRETVAALPKAHVDSYHSGNKLWGLPQVVQSVGLFPQVVARQGQGQGPRDWEEMMALAERFTKDDPDGNGQQDTFGYCIFGAPGRHQQLRRPVPLFGRGGREQHRSSTPTGSPRSTPTRGARSPARSGVGARYRGPGRCRPRHAHFHPQGVLRGGPGRQARHSGASGPGTSGPGPSRPSPRTTW